MPASSRALLTDLPKGHQFPPLTFSISEEDVRAYLDAVDDGNAVYAESGLAPPLAVGARALGALLELLELPAGTLHTGQEVEVRGGVAIGSTVFVRGTIGQRSERGGAVICAIDFEVRPEGGDDAAMTGRTTVLVAPAGGAS